jgi:hypothetical protein
MLLTPTVGVPIASAQIAGRTNSVEADFRGVAGKTCSTGEPLAGTQDLQSQWQSFLLAMRSALKLQEVSRQSGSALPSQVHAGKKEDGGAPAIHSHCDVTSQKTKIYDSQSSNVGHPLDQVPLAPNAGIQISVAHPTPLVNLHEIDTEPIELIPASRPDPSIPTKAEESQGRRFGSQGIRVPEDRGASRGIPEVPVSQARLPAATNSQHPGIDEASTGTSGDPSLDNASSIAPAPPNAFQAKDAGATVPAIAGVGEASATHSMVPRKREFNSADRTAVTTANEFSWTKEAKFVPAQAEPTFSKNIARIVRAVPGNASVHPLDASQGSARFVRGPFETGAVQGSGDDAVSTISTKHGAQGASIVSDGPKDEQVFVALDGRQGKGSPTWVHADAHSAEAGYQDPNLGWVSVRAHSDAQGLHATLSPDSPQSAQALNGHLGDLGAFLRERHSHVESLSVTSPVLSSASQMGDQGSEARQQQDRREPMHDASVVAERDSAPNQEAQSVNSTESLVPQTNSSSMYISVFA